MHKRFIDFLDEFSNQSQKNLINHKQFESFITHHYIDNQLYTLNDVGGNRYPNVKEGTENHGVFSNQFTVVTKDSCVTESQPNSHIQHHPHYYSYFTNSNWNNTTEQITTENTLYWSKPEDIAPTICRNPTPITEKIHIDVSLNSINDLIDILEKYEYKPNIEYNINLQFLQNIKTELVEIRNMIGMETLKKSILEQLVYFIQDLHVGKNVSDFKHTAIFGPPGTGKTEVAKIIGRMYSKLGVLKNNVFKKVTRSDLVAGYLGQTAIKTTKVINECLGGVLFIDEAYSLASREDNDTFSKECIDTLCEALSDHKDNIMVIVAGYENELNETFFRVNRGMESRFIWRFKIEGYDAKQLCSIFKKKVREQEWDFEMETDIREKWFEDKKESFKNYGRDVELLVVYTKIAHGKRIYGKPAELRKKISLQDVNAGFAIFENNKQHKKKPDYLSSLYV